MKVKDLIKALQKVGDQERSVLMEDNYYRGSTWPCYELWGFYTAHAVIPDCDEDGVIEVRSVTDEEAEENPSMTDEDCFDESDKPVGVLVLCSTNAGQS